MSNLSKDLILDGYWVNKKSGTIHWVSEDEADYTVELEDLYIIKPAHPWWPPEQWADVPSVPEGFRFTSDANKNWLSAEELKSVLP